MPVDSRDGPPQRMTPPEVLDIFLAFRIQNKHSVFNRNEGLLTAR